MPGQNVCNIFVMVDKVLCDYSIFGRLSIDYPIELYGRFEDDENDGCWQTSDQMFLVI